MADTYDKNPKDKSPLDIAADIFVFAPIGVALEVGKHLPDLAREGRSVLEGPLGAAKAFGKIAVDQGRKEFEERFNSTERSANSDVRPPTPQQGPPAAELAIESYDTMPVADVLAHLDSLGVSELGKIRSYEVANRGRSLIVERCDQLIAKAPGA